MECIVTRGCFAPIPLRSREDMRKEEPFGPPWDQAPGENSLCQHGAHTRRPRPQLFANGGITRSSAWVVVFKKVCYKNGALSWSRRAVPLSQNQTDSVPCIDIGDPIGFQRLTSPDWMRKPRGVRSSSKMYVFIWVVVVRALDR